MPIVAPEHRPTLREELAPLPKRTRWAVLAVLGLLLAALLVALTREASVDGTRVVVNAAGFDFNLRYPDRSSASTRLRASCSRCSARTSTRSSSSRSSCPPTRARSAASCRSSPRASSTRSNSASREIEPVEEGKTRINQAAGYTLAFRVSRSPRLYGRLTLLPEPVPGARTGVKLLMLATPDGGRGNARDVGTSGAAEDAVPLASLRDGAP